jgi:hypothetical protein
MWSLSDRSEEGALSEAGIHSPVEDTASARLPGGEVALLRPVFDLLESVAQEDKRPSSRSTGRRSRRKPGEDLARPLVRRSAHRLQHKGAWRNLLNVRASRNFIVSFL